MILAQTRLELLEVEIVQRDFYRERVAECPDTWPYNPADNPSNALTPAKLLSITERLIDDLIEGESDPAERIRLWHATLPANRSAGAVMLPSCRKDPH
jgi:hypothetical protein